MAGLGLVSQGLSSSPHLATNKPYFVHHREGKMSSAFSSDYIGLLSLGEVVIGGRPGNGSAVTNHSPPTSRGSEKLRWLGQLPQGPAMPSCC